MHPRHCRGVDFKFKGPNLNEENYIEETILSKELFSTFVRGLTTFVICYIFLT